MNRNTKTIASIRRWERVAEVTALTQTSNPQKAFFNGRLLRERNFGLVAVKSRIGENFAFFCTIIKLRFGL